MINGIQRDTLGDAWPVGGSAETKPPSDFQLLHKIFGGIYPNGTPGHDYESLRLEVATDIAVQYYMLKNGLGGSPLDWTKASIEVAYNYWNQTGEGEIDAEEKQQMINECYPLAEITIYLAREKCEGLFNWFSHLKYDVLNSVQSKNEYLKATGLLK